MIEGMIDHYDGVTANNKCVTFLNGKRCILRMDNGKWKIFSCIYVCVGGKYFFEDRFLNMFKINHQMTLVNSTCCFELMKESSADIEIDTLERMPAQF